MKKIHIMLCLALGILVSGCFTSYVSTKQMMGIYQGMTQSQVESVLGKPDFRRGWLRCAAAKENAGGQQRRWPGGADVPLNRGAGDRGE